MPQLGSTILPALRRLRLLARLRAEAAAVLRQWPVLVFAACYTWAHPDRLGETGYATIVFFWVKRLIEAYRVTITVHRREPAEPIPPFCPHCPRATGRRLPTNSLN